MVCVFGLFTAFISCWGFCSGWGFFLLGFFVVVVVFLSSSIISEVTWSYKTLQQMPVFSFSNVCALFCSFLFKMM